jgi:hypothetical protein
MQEVGINSRTEGWQIQAGGIQLKNRGLANAFEDTWSNLWQALPRARRFWARQPAACSASLSISRGMRCIVNE